MEDRLGRSMVDRGPTNAASISPPEQFEKLIQTMHGEMNCLTEGLGVLTSRLSRVVRGTGIIPEPQRDKTRDSLSSLEIELSGLLENMAVARGQLDTLLRQLIF